MTVGGVKVKIVGRSCSISFAVSIFSCQSACVV